MRIDLILVVTKQVGVVDVVITQHRKNAPNTHNCSSSPIDGIFLALEILQTIHSGYLAFGEGIPNNHWAVWIDIPASSSIGLGHTTQHGTIKSM